MLWGEAPGMVGQGDGGGGSVTCGGCGWLQASGSRLGPHLLQPLPCQILPEAANHKKKVHIHLVEHLTCFKNLEVPGLKLEWLDCQRICLSLYQLLLPDVLLACHITSGLYISLDVLPSWTECSSTAYVMIPKNRNMRNPRLLFMWRAGNGNTRCSLLQKGLPRDTKAWPPAGRAWWDPNIRRHLNFLALKIFLLS